MWAHQGIVAIYSEWAIDAPEERVPMVMNGPIIVAKPLRRWSWMGPYLVLKNTTYGHEWARYIS